MNTAGHIDPAITGPRREEAGKNPQPLPVSPSAGQLVTKLDMTYLTKMVGYDDNAVSIQLAMVFAMLTNEQVHMRSRDYLRDMMYYHMDSELRGPKFLNVPQPNTLPAELSTNLEDRYRNWMKDVYAPAYLTYMISETNTNFRDKYKFSDKEKARIAYWWTGTVSAFRRATLSTGVDRSSAGQEMSFFAARIPGYQQAMCSPCHAQPSQGTAEVCQRRWSNVGEQVVQRRGRDLRR